MEATLPAKRRQKAEFAAPIQDRLPPHSIEAEQGLLGCILLDSLNAVEVCDAAFRGRQVFYDERHKVIYRAAQHLAGEGDGFDLMMLRQHLKERKKLDGIGGMEYLVELENAAGSKAQLQHYLAIVLEKFDLREIIASCTEAVAKAYDFTGPVAKLKAEVQADLRQVFGDPKEDFSTKVASWNDLIDFDTDNDENCVIGMRKGKTTRWLCRGHGAWLIGPSGVGKSSLMMAFGASFALGVPRWGVTPVRPLRVGIIQAENDEGDMSEMAKGVAMELKLDPFEDEESLKLIQKNLITISTTGRVGQEFCRWLRDQIIELKLDLVLADPLLSFAGIDVSRQDQASMFCRVWLDPVLRETGAVLLSVHHTGKPPRVDGKQKSEPTLYDMAYSGIGSSELVNWARAIMLVVPVGNGIFRLLMAKRGKRAWATHPNGEPTQTLWLKHGAHGLYWEQIEPPEEPEPNQPDDKPLTKPQQIAVLNLSSFLSVCPPNGESKRDITRRLSKWLGSKDCPKKSLAASDGSIRNALELMLDNEKLKLVDGMYCKGPQA